jgi:hypothetical protein
MNHHLSAYRDLWRARCRDDRHAGFGRRLGETHRSKYRQGAPSRPHTASGGLPTDCFSPKHTRVPRVATRRARLECRDLQRRVSACVAVVTQLAHVPLSARPFWAENGAVAVR